MRFKSHRSALKKSCQESTQSPQKSQQAFFHRNWTRQFKNLWMSECQSNQSNFKNSKDRRSLKLPHFETDYKAIIIQTVHYCSKERGTDQQKQERVQEQTHTIWPTTLTKVSQQFSGELFSQMPLVQLGILVGEKKQLSI